MWDWFKKNHTTIITIVVSICFVFFMYSCESSVKGILDPNVKVNRAELQVELDRINSMAAVRIASLDQQDKFRQLLFENALVLAAGSPFSPVGLLTGIAAIYGLVSAGSSTVKTIKNNVINPKVNNGTA